MDNKVHFNPGTRFGRLMVIRELQKTRKKTRALRVFSVRCDCGKRTTASYSNLRYGRKKSCGCLSAAHGGITQPKSPYYALYQAWRGMHKRCYDRKYKSWYRYGGRGITICRAWKNLGTFVAWAVANGWKPGLKLELDRKKNNKGYSPSNCQWLTKKEHHKKHGRFIHEKLKLDASVFLSLPT